MVFYHTRKNPNFEMHIHPIRFGIHLHFMDLRKEFHPRLCRKFWGISPLQWLWIFYVCSLIEFIARKTKNHRQDVIRYFSKKDIQRQLRLAEVNHCLSFEQVSDELIEDYGIKNGDFDTVKECKYEVTSVTSIGMLYQELVLSTMKEEDASQGIIDVFSSFITDEISDFNSSVYYTNPDYLRCSYLSGEMLA